MLSLVTSALALTVGMKAGQTPTRVPPATMAASFESKFCYTTQGKAMAESISMAAATPMTMDGKYKGGATLSETVVRASSSSAFVYGDRVPLGQAIGCIVPTQGKALPAASTPPMLKPMNFN